MITPLFINKSIIPSGNNISFKQKNEIPAANKSEHPCGYVGGANKKILEDLSYAFDSITEILNKKTASGIKSIVNEAKDFNTSDGLTFKNIDEQHNSISIDKITRKQFDRYVKILVKDSSYKAKEGYLIKDNDFIVKNFDIKSPNKLPEKPEMYTRKELEELSINDKLNNILTKLDKPMLKARIFVISRKEGDLKPSDALLPQETYTKLKNIQTLTGSTNEMCKDIPAASLTRLKNEYGDYAVQLGQSAHKLKNIGEDKIQIVYSEFNSAYNGSFQRILVYNADNSLKTGYLFQNNKIISNFNPEYPSFLPDRIDFVNVEEIKEPHYNEELNTYLDSYAEKLDNYKEFVAEQRRTPAGSLKADNVKKMVTLDNLYLKIENTLKKVSINTINKVKNAYPDYDMQAGKKGFSFVNVGKEKLKVNIFKSKAKGEDEVIKLTMSKPDGSDEVSLIIKNNTKFVLNYNTPDSVMQSKLKILEHLDEFNTKLEDFLVHSEVYVESIPKGKVKKSEYAETMASSPCIRESKKLKITKKTKTEKNKTTALKPKKDKNAFVKEKEYQDLIKDSIRQLKDTLKGMKGNISMFDEQTAKIRQTLVDFIDAKKKEQ